MKLEEGNTYLFKVLKSIFLLGGNENLVLLGPDARKYLLPLEYYQAYGLQNSKEILCRVDKINCSGKVFLEPQHPFYREGSVYEFTVSGSSDGTDASGKPASFYSVTDIYGNMLSLPVSLTVNALRPGEKVCLKIERISKGKIYFSKKKGDDDQAINLEEGKTYRFRIERTEKNADEEEFFVASDIHGGEHLLNVRYYGHYGFAIGDTFRGRVIRYGAGKRKTIEPENPWYRPGEIIEVTLAGMTPLGTEEGFMAEVFDSFGFSHNIFLEAPPVSTTLRCRILKMRKGRPVFEVLT